MPKKNTLSNLNEKLSSETALSIIEEFKQKIENSADSDEIKHFLHETGRSYYLNALPNEKSRLEWLDIALEGIQNIGYSFLDLFLHRVSLSPEKPLFQTFEGDRVVSWTYEQIRRITREMAASFWNISNNPRVAIISDNSVLSASTDLACLMYDVFVVPLNTHFNGEIINEIFDLVDINIVVVDSEHRVEMMRKLRKKSQRKFEIFCLNTQVDAQDSDFYCLSEYSSQFNKKDIESILDNRKKYSIDQVCTTMFTSGSTGRPKGVSFSQYNLVSKRFARAAALPDIGRDEVFLCFLPLFHTFGRYLEMMGTIYWHGTYVFAGNPSADTLFALFPKVNPTVFISIPLRWSQMYDRILDASNNRTDEESRQNAIKKVSGSRLKFGLSAAGYLDPKIFQFFERNGINLCSGFGMTEATGGITMTPPGGYVKGSTGKALPGVYLKLAENGELMLRGHYIARYLDDRAPGDVIEFPRSDDEDYWMPTGDIFKRNDEGFYEIVDRVKDIYKNNKGQTIAPRNVEKRFAGVPGIKNTFLVGDGRSYNSLLIVPDFDDPVLQGDNSSYDSIRQYFNQIIQEANRNLVPYERVINYEILERDFSQEKGELTPKKSFNRKAIERNFAETIERLYIRNFIMLNGRDFRIRIPRWTIRDLGIVESNLIYENDTLINISSGEKVVFKRIDDDIFRIGDFDYKIKGNEINFGIFLLNPFLWAGNPQLINFFPCKTGWDTSNENVSLQIRRSEEVTDKYLYNPLPELTNIKNRDLIDINELSMRAYFAEKNNARKALERMNKMIGNVSSRHYELIRKRLEGLAYHNEEEIRCHAYRILLMDEPNIDYNQSFPVFIESGKSFLNEESIEALAKGKLERHRLEAIRKRLLNYRLYLDWPADDNRRAQFENIFRLLVNFVKYHPGFYSPVRVELTGWIMHRKDPELSKIARKYFEVLSDNYEKMLAIKTPHYDDELWLQKIVFDDELRKTEINRIKEALIGTTFLKQSVMLAFDEDDFKLEDVKNKGIWISKLNTAGRSKIYRVSISNIDNKHFDLQMVIDENLGKERNLETVFWLVSIAGFPYGPKVISKLGCCRPELGARSMVYFNELTLWEKLRELSGTRHHSSPLLKKNVVRRLFTEAMTAFFRAWRNSEYAIVPGLISPGNVVVPELDYREGAAILSIAGWKDYINTLSIVRPMLKSFYRKVFVHFPWFENMLDRSWLFDAVYEALDNKEAREFLEKLKDDLENNKLEDIGCKMLCENLDEYLLLRSEEYYLPLALNNAVDRFKLWLNLNPEPTEQAVESMLIELYRLYRLNRYPELVRYHLYRKTYFRNSGAEVRNAFDKLLQAMEKDVDRPAIHFIELSDLQSVLETPEDKFIFSKLVFPKTIKRQSFEVVKPPEEGEKAFLRTHITDTSGEKYIFREALEPAEVGQLYRLFIKEKFPKTISELDRYFVVINSYDKIIGGICYKMLDDHGVFLDGSIISPTFNRRGIGSNMIESFMSQMATIGKKYIKTHFYLRDFYLKMGFKVDHRWGGLVKELPVEAIEKIAISEKP